MSSLDDLGTQRQNLFHVVTGAFFARPTITRWVLAGPVALIATLLTMMGMSIWWPEGAARIDNIAMPVILFPLIWAGFFIYPILADNLPRAAAVLLGIILANAALLFIG